MNRPSFPEAFLYQIGPHCIRMTWTLCVLFYQIVTVFMKSREPIQFTEAFPDQIAFLGHQPAMCWNASICRGILSVPVLNWTWTAVTVDIWALFALRTPTNSVPNCNHLPENFLLSSSKMNPKLRSQLIFEQCLLPGHQPKNVPGYHHLPEYFKRSRSKLNPNCFTVYIWALFALRTPTDNVSNFSLSRSVLNLNCSCSWYLSINWPLDTNWRWAGLPWTELEPTLYAKFLSENNLYMDSRRQFSFFCPIFLKRSHTGVRCTGLNICPGVCC
jgi:hypothetical protein